MSTEAVKFPLLRHMNGSGYKNLIEQYLPILETIQTAIDQAHQAMPHERDYYISRDPNYYCKARGEYAAHLTELYGLKDYFQAMCMSIQEQWEK